jgi:chlorite dismutase
VQSREAIWHFRCPECGFGDEEFGYLLEAAEIHCFVCLEEMGRQVRVHRWIAEADQTRLQECPVLV